MISVAFLWFGIKGEFAFVFFAWGPLAAVALCLKHFGKPGSSGVPFLPFAVFSAIIVAPKYAIWALPM
jgi:hypothetical protein